MNEAEYLSYKQSRLDSYSQYALIDQAPPASFDTGLINPNGKPKPGYAAYRMPVWLPSASTRKGRKLEVWGDVRPAYYATLDTGKAQSVARPVPGRLEGRVDDDRHRADQELARLLRCPPRLPEQRLGAGSPGPIRPATRC